MKTTMNQSSRLVDILVGITAKTVIKSLIPDSKHSLKNIISVSLTGGLPPLQMRRINSSATIKATCCLKPFKQRPKLLIQGISASSATKKLILPKECNRK